MLLKPWNKHFKNISPTRHSQNRLGYIT